MVARSGLLLYTLCCFSVDSFVVRINANIKQRESSSETNKKKKKSLLSGIPFAARVQGITQIYKYIWITNSPHQPSLFSPFHGRPRIKHSQFSVYSRAGDSELDGRWRLDCALFFFLFISLFFYALSAFSSVDDLGFFVFFLPVGGCCFFFFFTTFHECL